MNEKIKNALVNEKFIKEWVAETTKGMSCDIKNKFSTSIIKNEIKNELLKPKSKNLNLDYFLRIVLNNLEKKLDINFKEIPVLYYINKTLKNNNF